MRLRTTGTSIDVGPALPGLQLYLESLDGLVAAWIYGSYGTPWQTPLSDLDLALLYRRGKAPAPLEEWRVQQRISEILGEEDVSVSVLNRAPVLHRFKVLETGRPLVCRDEEALADFVEEVLIEHGDFIVDHERFLAEYDRELMERYGR